MKYKILTRIASNLQEKRHFPCKNLASFARILQILSKTNGSHHMPTTKLTHFVMMKDEWDAMRALVSPCRMDCMQSGTAKDTSQTEVMLNSKKISSLQP